MGDPEPRLRLLETTRVYAREKLTESGEHNAVAGAMQNISEVSFKPLLSGAMMPGAQNARPHLRGR